MVANPMVAVKRRGTRRGPGTRRRGGAHRVQYQDRSQEPRRDVTGRGGGPVGDETKGGVPRCRQSGTR